MAKNPKTRSHSQRIVGDTGILLDLAAGRKIPQDASLTPRMIEMARRHGLIGALSRQSTSPLVRGIHHRDLARSEVMRKHTREVLERMGQSGVRASLLKGPAIARVYRDPRIRQFSDVDLLVEPSSLESALDVIKSFGSLAKIPPKRPKADKRDILFVDPSGVHFNLDLHWDMFSYSQLRDDARGATAEAWSGATRIADDGWGARWDLPQPHVTAFLAAHAVLDHRFRLILFRDLLELMTADFDWQGLLEYASRWGLRSTTYLALNLTRNLLGAAVPDGFLADLRPRSLALSYLDRALPNIDVTTFDGHVTHPVNLAMVTLNDSLSGRISQVARAPTAFPGWRKRVQLERRNPIPRVLILVSSDQRRGAEVFTERLQAALVERGWVADSLALHGTRDGGTSIPALFDEAPEGRLDLRVARALRSAVREHGPDLVIANGGSTLRYGVAATLFSAKRLVYISIGEPRFWIRSRFSRVVNRLMLRTVDHVFAVSAATKAQTIELEPSLVGKVATTYTGVPSEMFRDQPKERGTELRVVMVGSLSSEKDPELALNSIVSMPHVRLRFVGDGPLRSRLEELARELEVENRVEFTGSVPDVGAHLDWAHLLLLTSRSEGLPGAILEAGAAGLPTVAVDVGGVSEAVIDGKTGFVVSRDSNRLSEAIGKFVDSESLRSDMGDAAREHVRAKFHMDKIVEGYIENLKEVHR